MKKATFPSYYSPSMIENLIRLLSQLAATPSGWKDCFNSCQFKCEIYITSRQRFFRSVSTSSTVPYKPSFIICTSFSFIVWVFNQFMPWRWFSFQNRLFRAMSYLFTARLGAAFSETVYNCKAREKRLLKKGRKLRKSRNYIIWVIICHVGLSEMSGQGSQQLKKKSV